MNNEGANIIEIIIPINDLVGLLFLVAKIKSNKINILIAKRISLSIRMKKSLLTSLVL